MILSITIDETNKDCGKFIITDTSDYETDVITHTKLVLTDPSDEVHDIPLFSEAYDDLNETYEILPFMAGLTEWEQGVYLFQFLASTDGVTYEESSDYYFLNDCKSKKIWANLFEQTLEKYASDKQKDLVSTIRELIQASKEKFERFEFTEADRMIRLAYDLGSSECKNCS